MYKYFHDINFHPDCLILSRLSLSNVASTEYRNTNRTCILFIFVPVFILRLLLSFCLDKIRVLSIFLKGIPKKPFPSSMSVWINLLGTLGQISETIAALSYSPLSKRLSAYVHNIPVHVDSIASEYYTTGLVYFKEFVRKINWQSSYFGSLIFSCKKNSYFILFYYFPIPSL